MQYQNTFRQLIVWQKAKELTLLVYKITKKDRCHFFNIAQGSLVELDCHGEIAFTLKYIDDNNYASLLELINKTSFLLNKFINSQR